MCVEASGHPSSDINEQLKKFIVSSTDDLWKDQDFLLVVNTYLGSISKSLEFYSSVDACIMRAREKCLMIHYVYELYKREVKMESGEDSRCSTMLEDQLWLKERGGNVLGNEFIKVIRSVYEKDEGKAYMRVLEEIERAEATTDMLVKPFEAVNTEQQELFQRSYKLIKQLKKNLIRIKRWRKASTIMFGIGFFTVPVLSALVMVIPVPSAIEVLIGAFSATIGSIGKWCIYLWNKRKNAAKFQMDGLDLIMKCSYIISSEMEDMQKLVAKIFVDIEFVMVVRKYMREGKEMEKETMEKIENIMVESYYRFKHAQHSSLRGHSYMTSISGMISDRLSNVTPTTTPRKRSWLDIFM